jgi:hypothetical protein
MKLIKTFAAALFVSAIFAMSTYSQASLASLDGNRVDIEGQRGKVVILAVGGSWVPLQLSTKMADFTNTLARRYTGKDVVVYFVATDSTSGKSHNVASDDDLRKFATTTKLNVPILRDPDGGVVLKRYSIDQVPAFVIIDKTGHQAGEVFGGIDPKNDVTLPISKTVDKLL